jgi:hypothetical protein
MVTNDDCLVVVAGSKPCLGDGLSAAGLTAENLRVGTGHRLRVDTKSSGFDANDGRISLNQVIPYGLRQNRASTAAVRR